MQSNVEILSHGNTYKTGKEVLRFHKNNAGITLVALVITIIILLILAAITINLIIGQRGILTRAKEAGENYQEAATIEDEMLRNLLNYGKEDEKEDEKQDLVKEIYVSLKGNTLSFFHSEEKAKENAKDGGIYYEGDISTQIYAWYFDGNDYYTNTPWYNDRHKIEIVRFAEEIHPTVVDHYFHQLWKLTTIENIENLKTEKVTSMNSLFYYCSSLTNIDLSHFDTRNVTNMMYVFEGCSGLNTIDITSFNTEKVTTMQSMFKSCTNLETIKVDPTKFITSKVDNMFEMFLGCSKLTNIDVSYLDTSSVKNMSNMFRDCNNLQKIKLDPIKFNTSNVIDMSRNVLEL